MVKEAIKKLKSSTALGTDFWEVRYLKAMDEQALEALADLYNQIESDCTWPDKLLANIIVLMGKPNGGTRPIALMPMLYRVWAKARKPQLDQWCLEKA